MTNDDAIKWLDNLKNDLGNPHYERLWPYAQALDEIGEMLEERKPKQMWLCNGELCCPQCGAICKSYYHYCNECGQAVKWDG